MKQLWEGLRNSFFAGLLVVVPVAASVLILIWLFTGVTNFLLPASLREQMWGPLYRLVALVVFVVLTMAVGWATRRMAGKRALTMAEAVIAPVPLLNKTYGFVKEVSHTAFAGQKTMFQRVVLVEYPRPGAYTIAFATTEARGEARERTGSELVSVILPTPPNPTTGYLALFPREQVVDLEMNVADAMKMSFSAGAVVPLDPATGAR
jgi:uncharacterized membrane protein